MTTVLFTGKIGSDHQEHIKKLAEDIPGVRLLFRPDVDDETLELASRAEVLVSGHPTDELLESARSLKLHIVPFAGVQQVIERFRKINETRPVRLVNAHWNDYPTAQHMVALLLALTNRLIHYHANMVTGKWRVFEDGMASIPFKNRKVGLLGYGRVNKLVHRFLAGFEVSFGVLRRSWDKSAGDLHTPVKRFTPQELHPFLSWTDILLIALPMTPATDGLIRMPELELLGPDSLLVNASRGSIIDETDIYTALRDKVIAGAGLDVWYNYRPQPDSEGRKYPYELSHPFHELSNVVLSPHRGASPIKSLDRWDEVVENIRRFVAGEELINVVDLKHGY